jgi:hypothetical protein
MTDSESPHDQLVRIKGPCAKAQDVGGNPEAIGKDALRPPSTGDLIRQYLIILGKTE